MKKIRNKKYHFICPNDGIIDQKDVDFWCNRCESHHMIIKEDIYLCPSCLKKDAGNFRCRICGNEKVKMVKVK